MYRLFDRIKPKSRLDAETVHQAYRLFFGRSPESHEVIEMHLENHADVWSLLASLMASDEHRARTGQRRNVRTTLDSLEILNRYQQGDLQHRYGFVTNFLGVQTDVSFISDLQGTAGYVAGLPVPGDFHSSQAEWIAALRGVDVAGKDFVVAELGAGWGPWMADLCQAAKIRGASRTFAVGCEADSLHCEFIHAHLAHNGFAPRDYKLFQGAIGVEKGITLFPVSPDSSSDWGMRPIFCATEAEADAVVAGKQPDYRGHTFKRFHRVPCFTLADVLEGVDHVDVMHVDIQGDEYRLLKHNLEYVTRCVRYLVIGTHGRQIEGELIGLLAAAGWKLEVEEPCFFDINTPNYSPQIDGTQGWLNPALVS
jgi:FkbM family methyltransferase